MVLTNDDQYKIYTALTTFNPFIKTRLSFNICQFISLLSISKCDSYCHLSSYEDSELYFDTFIRRVSKGYLSEIERSSNSYFSPYKCDFEKLSKYGLNK